MPESANHLGSSPLRGASDVATMSTAAPASEAVVRTMPRIRVQARDTSMELEGHR